MSLSNHQQKKGAETELFVLKNSRTILELISV